MKLFRQLSCVGLFITLVGSVALLAWVVARYSTPRPVLVAAGGVQDYPPEQSPRLFSFKGGPFYLVNIDGELIALAARSVDHQIRCIARWQAALGIFVDPCLRTRFSHNGEYRGGGPPGELRRLPLKVRDSQVWVQLGYQ